MRLLTVTARYYFGLLFFILIAWSAILFMVLRYEVYENIDEVLVYRKTTLIENIRKDGRIPPNDKFHDFFISPVNKLPTKPIDIFSDTLLYKSKTGYDEYRKICSFFALDGNYYKLSFILPRLEQDEMIETLTFSLPIFLILFLAAYLFLINQLNKKIWSPFFEILTNLKAFKLENNSVISFADSDIYEFNELQISVKELTGRSTAIYIQQKQFTENASHEIQTPLAIIQSKLDLLFQNPLDKKQSDILMDISLAASRMSKINEALLLLTKIENHQFKDKSSVDILHVIESLLSFFEEQSSKLSIATSIEVDGGNQVKGNSILVSMLLSNLLKNAFLYNIQNGKVAIKLNENSISVSNTGNPLNVSHDKVFERFYTQASGKGGIGLGLAIVKSICSVNNWKISYSYKDGFHYFHIQF